MSLTRQVEELVLLRCSLLPDELLEFVLPCSEDVETWAEIVDAHIEGDLIPRHIPCPAQFTVKLRDAPLWFEFQLSKEYPLVTSDFSVTVRGYDISRAEQQRWQDIVRDKRAQLGQTDFPTYELVSLHLLPLLHNAYDSQTSPHAAALLGAELQPSEPIFHALLTSHHLKSPQKRRSLQQWSSELRLSGFAKVGHPGVIYCSGTETNVEEFVSKVKDMQWLALRVRFTEPLPEEPSRSAIKKEPRGSWLEVEKIGEVVEEMRKLGRENYVLDLGIGSGGGK